MKRLLRRVLYPVAAAALAAALFGCAKDDGDVTNPNPNEFKPKGTIQGRLLDAVTQQPIPGAIVDIGLAKATTTETGQFVLRNVPATDDATCDNCDVSGSYQATIDMRQVNAKRVADAKAASTVTNTVTAVLYPDFKIDSLTVRFTSFNDTEGDNAGGGAGSNHDTPIDYLADGYDLRVGKLDSHINGMVVKDSTGAPVGEGYTVKVAGTFGSDNNETGTDQNIIATTTTDADGRFLFSNLEAQRSVCIRVWSADKSMYGHKDVSTLADNETLFMAAQDVASTEYRVDIISPIHVAPLDDQRPFIIAVSPESGSDLDPNGTGNNVVTFTFSEAIKANAYTNGLTASAEGQIFDDVAVKYESKAGNVAHTLSWSEDRTKLFVTIAALAPSGRYTVTLNGLDSIPGVETAKMVDAAGKTLDLAKNGKHTTVFTTNGAPAPAAPTGLAVLTSAVDWVGEVALDWAVAAGAKTYNLYCAAVQKFADGDVTHQAVLVNDNWDILASEENLTLAPAGGDLLPLVENNQIERQFSCYVVGVSSDNLEGAASEPVIISDNVAPSIDSGDSDIDMPVVGETTTGTITLEFSEPMDEALADDVANYDLTENDAALATDLVPEIIAADYDATSWTTTLTITLTSAAATDTYNGEWTVTAATLTDVAGNTIKSTANYYNNGTETLPLLAVTFVNQTLIDAGGPGAEFDWNPYVGAKKYQTTCAMYESFPGMAPELDPYTVVNPWSTALSDATAATLNALTLVEIANSNHIAKFAECQVTAFNAADDAIARSAVIKVADVKKPKLVQPVQIHDANGVAASLGLPAAGTKDETKKMTLVFTEPMDEVAVETLANYTLTRNTGASTTEIIPVLSNPVYNPSNAGLGNVPSVTFNVTLDNTAGTFTSYSGLWTLTVLAGVTDVAGNAFDTSKAVNNQFSPLTAGTLTLTLLDTSAFGYGGQNLAGVPDFDWLPVAGAVRYKIFRNREIANSFVADNVLASNTTLSTFGSDAGFNANGFVDNNRAVTFVYQLFAYSDDAATTVIGQSNLIRIQDTIAPKVTGGAGFLAGLSIPLVPDPVNGNNVSVYQDFQVVVTFDEPMNLAALEAVGNYSLSTTTGATAPNLAMPGAEVVPALVRVDVLNNQQAQLTLRVTNPPEAAATTADTNTVLFNNLTLNVNVAASQTDVKGNALNGAADQRYNNAVPTGVTTNPF